MEVAYERYEFAHKSIQEYLAAEYILRLPSYPEDVTMVMPNEMALATAMSSDSGRYFSAVVRAAVSANISDLSGFSAPFLRRLSLEKVDFNADYSFGYSVITLYSENFFRSRGQLRLPFEVESDAFGGFLEKSVVQEAVSKALSRAEVVQQSDDTWIITWQDKGAKPQRCMIDINFRKRVGSFAA